MLCLSDGMHEASLRAKADSEGEACGSASGPLTQRTRRRYLYRIVVGASAHGERTTLNALRIRDAEY